MAKVRTCLWFDGMAEEAARFHVGLIPDSAVTSVTPGPGGKALIVDLTLAGAPYTYLNGGPMYRLSPAASVQVFTEDQAETDRLWDVLTGGGGAESRCAWCVDRFGVSWQVVPRALPGLIGGPDRDGARRATEAMLGMAKIDIAALEAAYAGTG
jgi:predicted 3-demethylubiquinone-9 3-methyltransferase (glyoxalase superfamily)